MVKFNKPIRNVHEVFIHCSASDNPEHDDISVIRRWHVEDNKWQDVGYHFFIRSDGEVQVGRSIDMIPAAQKGHNRGTIAICLHGLNNFSEAQFVALREFCGQINEAYSGKMRFRGHCEVAAKACPVFDYKAVLGLDSAGHIIMPEPKIAPENDMGRLTALADQLYRQVKLTHEAQTDALSLARQVAALVRQIKCYEDDGK